MFECMNDDSFPHIEQVALSQRYIKVPTELVVGVAHRAVIRLSNRSHSECTFSWQPLVTSSTTPLYR
jgi:hypothetical protein